MGRKGDGGDGYGLPGTWTQHLFQEWIGVHLFQNRIHIYKHLRNLRLEKSLCGIGQEQ